MSTSGYYSITSGNSASLVITETGRGQHRSPCPFVLAICTELMALEKGDHVMGFDIIGRNGNDFRNNGYWWGPLADYCREVAPDITKHCKYWYSNDWDGLSAK